MYKFLLPPPRSVFFPLSAGMPAGADILPGGVTQALISEGSESSTILTLLAAVVFHTPLSILEVPGHPETPLAPGSILLTRTESKQLSFHLVIGINHSGQ